MNTGVNDNASDSVDNSSNTAGSHQSAPGDQNAGIGDGAPLGSVLSYTAGYALALALTAASFLVSQTDLLWAPGVPAGLAVLAIAQMGVHLVFFLHISSGPDNTNNVIALAFGLMVVALMVGGTLWIMDHLNANMMPPTMQMTH